MENDETHIGLCNRLIIESFYGNVSKVKNLLARGADVNAKLKKHWQLAPSETSRPEFWCQETALMLASDGGHTKIVKLLLKKGADVNAKDEHYKTTALMQAAKEGHLKIVKLLLEHGAEVNKQDRHGETAETWATRLGHHELVPVLRLFSQS